MPTTITVSEFQPSPGECNFLGTTAKLRRYYDRDWLDIDNVWHAEGIVGSSTSFFDEINCTLAANTITVPSFSATPTDNALIGTPRETWQLWDQGGTARNVIFEGFIPSSPSTTTFGTLLIANQGQTLSNPPTTYLDAIGVQNLINIALGLLGKATSVVFGLVRLSVPAVVTADPVVVGDNDPRIAKTTGTDVLVAGASTTIASGLVVTNSPINAISADEGITGRLYPLNRIAGVSFDIASENGADAGNFKYFLF